MSELSKNFKDALMNHPARPNVGQAETIIRNIIDNTETELRYRPFVLCHPKTALFRDYLGTKSKEFMDNTLFYFDPTQLAWTFRTPAANVNTTPGTYRAPPGTTVPQDFATALKVKLRRVISQRHHSINYGKVVEFRVYSAHKHVITPWFPTGIDLTSDRADYRKRRRWR